MSLTKQQLIQEICLKLQLSKRESADLIEKLLELVKSTLESGEDVLISGFGKFCVHERGPRKGCNPQSGGDLYLDARRVVRFKPSGVLKRKLNGGVEAA